MSRNNDADIDPLPDEAPPPYEPISTATNETSTITAPSAPATAANNASAQSTTPNNPFLAPEEHRTGTTAAGVTASTSNTASSTNSFLDAVTPQQTGTSTAPTVTAPAASAAPALPPRTYAAPTSPALSQPAATRPSLESHHSRTSSIAAAAQPAPTSPSIYAPPSAPPPSSSASSSRPSLRPTDSYRPTTVPTPGQPLLRKGKILVYPRDWRGCPKCNDTGYKHGDPSNPHKSCWDKYGKTYTSAMGYSAGLNGATNHFQKPLPVLSGPPVGPGMGGRPSHGYMPGGYPGAGGGGFGGPTSPVQPGYGGYGPPTPMQPGYAGLGPPVHAPPPHPPQQQTRPPRTPTTPNIDAETEGARMSDVPPNYQDASNVTQDERLPSQYVPPPVPPPNHGPPPTHHPPPQHPSFQGPGPYAPAPPSGFVGGFTPNPGGPNPYVTVQHQPWYAARPPGALVVMPGDPRIGGRLCFECNGRGIIESFWLGDETCYRCRGSGRVF